jgi:hypothetical protein
MTLDPITRDRLIALLTVEFEECLDECLAPSPTRLAIVALNCLETAPELLKLLNQLAKQAIKTNALIAIAETQVQQEPFTRSSCSYGPPSY